MLTQLDAPLRRGLTIDGAPYVLTITPSGFLLTPKGRRKGFEMEWHAFVSGDAALATALNASVAQGPTPASTKDAPRQPAANRNDMEGKGPGTARRRR